MADTTRVDHTANATIINHKVDVSCIGFTSTTQLHQSFFFFVFLPIQRLFVTTLCSLDQKVGCICICSSFEALSRGTYAKPTLLKSIQRSLLHYNAYFWLIVKCEYTILMLLISPPMSMMKVSCRNFEMPSGQTHISTCHSKNLVSRFNSRRISYFIVVIIPEKP